MEKSYAGKIGNSSVVVAEALFKSDKAPKGVVHKGGDLRSGKSKG